MNPAYVYGFSISPTLRFGNLYARASAGYGWDWGKKTWNYQGSPMNTAGGIKVRVCLCRLKSDIVIDLISKAKR